MQNWLGKYPGRTLHRLGSALAGLWIASTILRILWPEADQIAIRSKMLVELKKTPLPKEEITILLIAIDEKTPYSLQQNSNATDLDYIQSLMLIKVDAYKPLEVLQIPTELAIFFPGEKQIHPLAATYRKGGVLLTSDFISEIIGFPSERIQRYIVAPTKSVKTLVDGINDITIKLQEPITSGKFTNKLPNKSPINTYRINGYRAKQLITSSQDKVKNRGIYVRNRRRSVIKGITTKVINPEKHLRFNFLTKKLFEEVQTNLTQKEFKTIAAAALSSSQIPIIRELPLASLPSESGLRDLKDGLKKPLWQ